MTYEEMTLLRINELREEAHRQRVAHELSAGRWWRWLAAYATRRAAATSRCC
ncbi:hypothetical protein LZ318_29145 [Saccharopolyspora indica]|uniref:hypothetical protein n=1 Tax=Saccharopolyspora indica TaxID=1229659 RepID=UPI0022EA8250|nr:hypothetical protein [Saccharopolyspora indica]MDA3646251.1 hypothetical protein [Saccharopolyspora indica]